MLLYNMNINLAVACSCACAILIFLNCLYRWILQIRTGRNRAWAGVQSGFLGYQRGKLRYIKHCREVIAEGLEKYGGRLFWVPTLIGPMAVVPPAVLAEVKSHPDLSFIGYFRDSMAGEYTQADRPFYMPNLFDVIKKNYMRSLDRITAILWEETQMCLDEYFPYTEEWRPIPLHQQLTTIISRVSGRIFVGPDLCRNKEWLVLTRDFLINVLTAGMTMRNFPSFTYPLIQYLIPSLKRTRATYPRVKTLISGVVSARRAREKYLDNKDEKPMDALQWTMDMGEPDENLADLQLFLAAVAIHTTGAALTHMIYDLCQHSWIVPELRREIEEIMVGEEVWSAQSSLNLHKLKLLDSFMKESQRMNPIQTCMMQRKSTATVKLSTGCTIPANSYMCVPVLHILHNPNIYPNPEKFDPYRFLRLREQSGEENGYQFASTNEKFCAFGLGKHACPGRFFAANEIKIILIALLTKYDMRFPESLVPSGSRPQNLLFEEQIAPNLTQHVEFRKRRMSDKKSLVD